MGMVWNAQGIGSSLKSLVWFEPVAFQGLGEYMVVALPTCLQLCGDWWSVEIATLCVGWLGADAQAAQAAHAATVSIFLLFLVPLSVGCALSATYLTGSALGENRPRKAKIYGSLCGGLAVSYWLFLGGCLILFPGFFTQLFLPAKAHADARHIMIDLLKLLAIYGVFNVASFVMANVMKGLGKQGHGSAIYLLGNWVIMLPCMFAFCFTFGWGVRGVWLARIVGAFITTVCLGVYLYRSNWAALATKISEDMRQKGLRLRKPSARGFLSVDPMFEPIACDRRASCPAAVHRIGEGVGPTLLERRSSAPADLMASGAWEPLLLHNQSSKTGSA